MFIFYQTLSLWSVITNIIICHHIQWRLNSTTTVSPVFTNINIPMPTSTSNTDKNQMTINELFVSWCSLMSSKFPAVRVIVYTVSYYIVYTI